MSPLPLVQKRSFVVTLGLLTGMAALTVDMSLPAVPAMVDALATSLSSGQQIVGIFMAGMAAGQIPAGLVSDRVGRLPVLYAGMGLFAVGATVAALANDINLMLAARFVQGFGAASAIVLSRAIVRDIATGKEAAKLMALMTMIFTVAPVIAPSIGAILIAQWGWRAPFMLIAAAGFVMLAAIRRNIPETHSPIVGQHPVQQLLSSVAEFFSHRQSVFGLLLIILPPAGFMSMIAISAALVVEIYGYSVVEFGLIFATAGISILIGSAINRLLVTRLDAIQVIGLGVALFAISGAQLLVIAWLNHAPFAWLWGNMCLFMFAVAIAMPNATVLSLDPLPRIAGVASSIIGTLQNIIGAAGALLGAVIYDGTIRNSVIVIGVAGMLVAFVFLLKPIICGEIVHHPEELARD
ncbi:MAG: multidrug effflux MFS transporter [Gammaproteobacteria bacterium]|nr:multidrug effflux MFS transporter [Gammaproteobacteria bacterium]MDH3372421.1 multidrug effflux MFS transporter [Gammaproteobacteria bacterium]MDH3409132.1 multidrug effflux MFS transporter [Gammaproteobacteria bacterium]MDH3551163.1 multidrug effflux MFS transporter [Gammaproteobacteria bacterium]